MISREILKKSAQIELRTNRVVHEPREHGCGLRLQPRSVSFSRRSKLIVPGRFGNCGGFATNGNCAATPWWGFNPVEFDGIRNLDRNHFTQVKP